jgi:hypothetical protein
MAQIVGAVCALCHDRIGSVLKGTICDDCGNPYHFDCAKPTEGNITIDTCRRCGGSLATAAAKQVHQQRERDMNAAQRAKQPTSKMVRV